MMKFGLLINGEKPPAWAQSMLSQMLEAQHLRAVTIIRVRSTTEFRIELLSNLRQKGYDTQSMPELVFEISNFNSVRRLIDVEKAAAALEALDLDFVLDLREVESLNSDLQAYQRVCSAHSRYGLWRLRFGDTHQFADLGLAEFAEKAETQVVTLESVHAPEQPARLLKSGQFKVYRHSLAFHQRSVVEQCADWPVSVSRQILSGCSSFTTAPVTFHSQSMSTAARLQRKLSARTNQAQAKAQRFAHRMLNQVMLRQWRVGAIERPINQVLNESDFENVHWWNLNEPTVCLADPFPTMHEGKLHILAEKFNYIDQIGSIASFSTTPDGSYRDQQEAIRFPFHLSYPCLVRENGELYASFEALQSNELAIYKCLRFPNLWARLPNVISHGSFSDPTIFQYEGRWWIFATSYDQYSEGNSCLHAWYSETDLNGPWKPHAQNPIKCDIQSSRSAGMPFIENGVMYRPSQNCKTHYGRSIIINKIDCLTPTEFAESKVKEISPGRHFPNGIHHIAGAGQLTVIDGRRDRISFAVAALKLARRFERLNKLLKREWSEWRQRRRTSQTPTILGENEAIAKRIDKVLFLNTNKTIFEKN
jgi:hypothetical protein